MRRLWDLVICGISISLHKLSRALIEEYSAIFIGNANALELAKTRMAKSVLDTGWNSFRAMLQYSCDYAGVWFDEVMRTFRRAGRSGET